MSMFKVGDKVRIKEEFDCELVQDTVGYVKGMENYKGKEAIIKTVITEEDGYDVCEIDIDNDLFWWHESQFELIEKAFNPTSEILFAKMRGGATIPSKREEDGAFDLYACFDEDYIIIQPHETKMIPTGICSAFSYEYVAILKERSSTGTKGLGQRAGVVDSGYRGEWFVPITNHNNTKLIIAKDARYEGGYTFAKGKGMIGLDKDFIIYPYEKAISQCIMVRVPQLSIREVTVDEILAISSERGTGALGSSGK